MTKTKVKTRKSSMITAPNKVLTAIAVYASQCITIYVILETK